MTKTTVIAASKAKAMAIAIAKTKTWNNIYIKSNIYGNLWNLKTNIMLNKMLFSIYNKITGAGNST